MSTHTFRNPDLFQVLPIREYLRRDPFLNGGQGFVLEDVDLVVRHYGANYGTDAKGKFMLIEMKHPGSFMGTAQYKTFGLIDELCRKSDPDRLRYIGFYVLNIAFDDSQLPIFPVVLNREHKLDEQGFYDWINGKTVLPSLYGGAQIGMAY